MQIIKKGLASVLPGSAMCGNTLNRTRAGGAIEIPKGPEKKERKLPTLVYIAARRTLIQVSSKTCETP